MQEKQIVPIGKINKKHITVTVPGSKSITNRALLLATLADGESRLFGALFSDDSRHFLKCVEELGFETDVEETSRQVTVKGLGGPLPKEQADIYVGSAGTAARFLAAYLGCSHGTYYMDASPQMRRRPMEPLLEALKSVGAEICCTSEEGHFPMQITGKGIQRHHIEVDIDKSSQFLSALLISGCLAKENLHIHIKGSHGMAYIQMTVQMMEQFGVCAEQVSEKEFVIKAGQSYVAQDYYIEPDASAAAYFWAMAAMLGISVTVAHTHFSGMQGDVEFALILEKMGCTVEDTQEGITVTGPADGRLLAVEADMHACSDQAITLAAIAPFCDGPVHITGIAHIRLQESDRIAAIVENLQALGVSVKEEPDGVLIYPYIAEQMAESIEDVLIRTHDDHRLAMGFALTGLRKAGIRIEDPLCCRKTFENYFEVLEQAVREIQGEDEK